MAKPTLFGLVFVILSILPIGVPAKAAGAEIEKLLTAFDRSGCQFERNGKLHQATEAKKHMRDKWDYFQSDIQSAEDFIRLAATQSALSGKPYFVVCPGQPKVLSKDWLLHMLKQIRSNQASPSGQ